MGEEIGLTQLLNLGTAVAIAVYLVYWVTKKMDKKIEEVKKILEEIKGEMDEMMIKLGLEEEVEE